MPHPRRALALLTLSIACLPSPVAAQTIGTFRWQLHPYCNLVTVVVEQVGPVYRLTGTDDQCGVGTAAAVNGEAHLTSGTTVALGFTIVTSPSGRPVHVSADVALPAANGVWEDSTGATGQFVLTVGAPVAGTARPMPPLPLVYGRAIDQGSATTDQGLTVRVATDTGGLGDAAAIYGRFGGWSGFAQPANAGVRGDSADDSGVVGTSGTGVGVNGQSNTGVGVRGFSFAGTAVVAEHIAGGTALDVRNGALRVSGVTRPAFRHVAAPFNTVGNLTRINHPLLNVDPDAMVFVTHMFGPGAAVYTQAVGVYYDNSTGKWTIFREDGIDMPVGAVFNVLVVKYTP